MGNTSGCKNKLKINLTSHPPTTKCNFKCAQMFKPGFASFVIMPSSRTKVLLDISSWIENLGSWKSEAIEGMKAMN